LPQTNSVAFNESPACNAGIAGDHIGSSERERCGALALRSQAVKLTMQHRDQDRWQVPIMLGLGVVQPTNPHLIEIVLRRLLDRNDDGVPKDDERWYRDMLLAADIGVDRDWNYLREQGLATDELRRTLAHGLATMLNDRRQFLPVAERVRAGFLLGDLGDPRFPVTLDDWRNELAKIAAGDESGYFCRVPAGRYLVGSSDDDPDARDEEKPQYQFQLQVAQQCNGEPAAGRLRSASAGRGGMGSGGARRRRADLSLGRCVEPGLRCHRRRPGRPRVGMEHAGGLLSVQHGTLRRN